MPRRPNELVREAIDTLTSHGFTPAISNGSKHIKVTWVDDSRRQVFVVPCTPSDYRTRANSRAALRRLLRQAGAVEV
jgi:hypothetical protein